MTLLIYRKALIAILATALFSNLTLFLLNNEFSPITVTHVTLALAVASVPLLFQLPRRGTMPWSLVGWCVGFLAISVVFVVGSRTYIGESDHFWDRLFGILFLLLNLLLFSDPRVHRFGAGAVACVLLVSVGLNLFEGLNPGAFSQVEGRAAGLYENPNQAGAALILAMILSMEVAGPTGRIALALATGAGVFLTFSRSATIAWFVVTCIIFAQRRQIGRLARNCLVLVVVGVVVALVAKPDLVGHLQDVGTLNRNTSGRASLEIGSASDVSRLFAARLALEVAADYPILGLGTGASSEPPFDQVGPHNVYLALMVDHGVLGILIFPLFLVAATWGSPPSLRALTIPFAIFLAYWGLFSHNVLEERYILIAVALVASMVAAGRTSGGEAGGSTP